MAFGGDLGLSLDLRQLPREGKFSGDDRLLFSESATRLLFEVPEAGAAAFEKAMAGFPVRAIGRFEEGGRFTVTGSAGAVIVDAGIDALFDAWNGPFKDW